LALQSLFGKNAKIRLIDFFLKHPRNKLTRKVLRDELKTTKITLGRIIPELIEAGILREEGTYKRSKLYCLNTQNPQVKALHELRRLLL
jgi:predicted HTH transcriptional regulator